MTSDHHLDSVYGQIVGFLQAWDNAENPPDCVLLLRKCVYQLGKLQRIINQHRHDDQWVVDYLIGSGLDEREEIEARLKKTLQLIPIISEARSQRSMRLLNPYEPTQLVGVDDESNAYGDYDPKQGGRERARATE